MVFFDFFKNIFCKKENEVTVQVTGNSESGISVKVAKDLLEINGVAVDLPCDVSRLCEILGSAREDEKSTPLRSWMVWDDLGICCYIKGELGVYSIEFRTQELFSLDSKPSHYPKSLYKGNITISDAPWFQVMRKGKKTQSYRSIRKGFGKYTLISEFASSQGDKTRSAKDYASFSIGVEH